MAKKGSGSSKPTSTSKGKERPPPIDKLLKPAIGIGLALLAYQFIKGINQEIPRINVDDELELRHVFFGEIVEGSSASGGDENTTDTKTATTATNNMAKHSKYAILCHDESSNIPVSSVFQEAFVDGSAPAEFRLLDCNHILSSSEKTIAERFELNLKQRPTIFVTGIDNTNKKGELIPKQVPTKHLKTGSMLVKALKNLLEPKAEKLETTQDLRSKCLDKDICAVLLKGSKTSPNYVKDAMTKLIKDYTTPPGTSSSKQPKVTFGVVDTSVLYIKNVEEYLPEYVTGQPRFVIFQKVAGGSDKGGDRLKTSISFLPTSGVSYGPMSSLLDSVLGKTATVQKISSLPTIKTRTKKLEQEERAKRERKKKSQQEREQEKNQQSGSSSSGGAFTDNDGSAEGRRAEREKRRAEHQKNNPNYKEKTPEEIAEIERKRRQRMEEEAARWNIVDGDIDPSGDGGGSYEEEDDYEDYNDEDEEESTNNDDDGGGDDDDVLDLD